MQKLWIVLQHVTQSEKCRDYTLYTDLACFTYKYKSLIGRMKKNIFIINS